jgi:phosphoglycolate phosphatase
MVNFDSVIFDFDGTVADTGEGVFDSVRYAIRMEGLAQPSDEDIRKFIGPPLFESFHSEFPEIDDDRVQKLIIHFRAKYSVDGIYKFKVYDGMETLLDNLHRAGVKTAIASSKADTFINFILKNCGLAQYFDEAVGANMKYTASDKSGLVGEALERMKVTDRNRVLMVGDRKYDIEGAHKQNVACAAVLFGYGNLEEFKEYKAEYIVKDCAELEKIIVG